MSGVTQLYSFSNFTFNTCGATGSNGPSLAQVYTSYTGVAWSNYISVSETRPGIQLWTPPASTVYYCEVAGCSGAWNPGNSTGAIMRGDIFLDKTKQYQLLIGQRGGSTGGGITAGSGGTFLVDSNDIPLIIAGGGGGNRLNAIAACASVTTTGVTGNAAGGTGSAGGVNGAGGAGGTAGGGGGFLTNGGSAATTGGKAFLNGGIGGAGSNTGGTCNGRARDGGFGGGAGVNTSCAYISGGGGGYSGGGSAQSGQAIGNAGGGGGSYNIAIAQSNSSLTDGNSNLGYITVKYSTGVPDTGIVSLKDLGQRIGVDDAVIKYSDMYNKYNSGPVSGTVSLASFRGLTPVFA
jgi:hypothetical protein